LTLISHEEDPSPSSHVTDPSGGRSVTEPPPTTPALMIVAGVSLALVGCAIGLVGSLGLDQPWTIMGWATFVVGWIIAAVAAVKAGFRFGRGKKT
jgi:hypothetical protein